MKVYNYILLDWDGNIAKTLDVWLEACRIVLHKRSIMHSDEEISVGFGALDEYFIGAGVSDVRAAIGEVNKLARQHLPKADLYPDALEVLKSLHAKNKKLALITTSSHSDFDSVFDRHNLTKFFSTIVTGEDVTHHKPHPEPLEKGLEQLSGNKAQAIMVGDSDKDIRAANRAGIDSILFYPPEHERFYKLQDLSRHKPTYIISDFRELVGLVN